MNLFHEQVVRERKGGRGGGGGILVFLPRYVLLCLKHSLTTEIYIQEF